MNENYKKTRDAYRKLGKQYIENTASINLHVLPEFMKRLPKGGRVLDVGCIGGRDSKKFADAGFEVIGIDVVDVFLEEARKYVPQAKFLEMDMLKIDFPDNYFDGILAHAVLLHLEKNDVSGVLANFYRILKKGGIIDVGVKLGEGEGFEADGKLAENEKRFFSYFNKEEIESYVKEAGFEIILSQISPDYVGRGREWIIVWGEKR